MIIHVPTGWTGGDSHLHMGKRAGGSAGSGKQSGHARATASAGAQGTSHASGQSAPSPGANEDEVQMESS